jgi:hypothetical protein
MCTCPRCIGSSKIWISLLCSPPVGSGIKTLVSKFWNWGGPCETAFLPTAEHGASSACGGAARARRSRRGAGARNPANLRCSLACASCHAVLQVRLYACLPHAEPRARGGVRASCAPVSPPGGPVYASSRALLHSRLLSAYMRI